MPPKSSAPEAAGHTAQCPKCGTDAPAITPAGRQFFAFYACENCGEKFKRMTQFGQQYRQKSLTRQQQYQQHRERQLAAAEAERERLQRKRR